MTNIQDPIQTGISRMRIRFIFLVNVKMWHVVSDEGANGVVHYRLVGTSLASIVLCEVGFSVDLFCFRQIEIIHSFSNLHYINA